MEGVSHELEPCPCGGLHRRLVLRPASNARALSEIIRTHFRLERPTAERCRYALQTFVAPQLDFQALAQNPGFERFAEFPRTPQAIRSEPGYRVNAALDLDPDHISGRALGLMYLNGEATPRDAAQAYRWFYAAWSLGGAGDGVVGRKGHRTAVVLSSPGCLRSALGVPDGPPSIIAAA
jgi:hypothetical protein